MSNDLAWLQNLFLNWPTIGGRGISKGVMESRRDNEGERLTIEHSVVQVFILFDFQRGVV